MEPQALSSTLNQLPEKTWQQLWRESDHQFSKAQRRRVAGGVSSMLAAAVATTEIMTLDNPPILGLATLTAGIGAMVAARKPQKLSDQLLARSHTAPSISPPVIRK